MFPSEGQPLQQPPRLHSIHKPSLAANHLLRILLMFDIRPLQVRTLFDLTLSNSKGRRRLTLLCTPPGLDHMECT